MKWPLRNGALGPCSMSVLLLACTPKQTQSDTPTAELVDSKPVPQTSRSQIEVHRVPIALPRFFAEGLAWSPTSERLFMGGIVAQSVMSVDADGSEPRPFAASPDAWSVFGIAVDDARGLVWATCSAVPQGRILPKEIGRAGVVAFDLADGAVRYSRLTAADDDAAHVFGDLALGDDGTVFVTDTKGGGVFATSINDDALTVVVPPKTFRSVQGIVWFDPSTLVVADYSTGLHHVRLDAAGGTAEVSIVKASAEADLRGIDGLALSGQSLAAVQNAAQPPRILRLDLSKDAARIESAEIAWTPSPDDGEPTLATFVGDELWVTQTDRWDRVFDEDGRPRQGIEIAAPVVVRIPWAG